MVEVYTVDDLEKQVQRTDCLVVVEVFVPACPGCRKLFPKIKQIASNNPDVRFVQVGPLSHLAMFASDYVLNRGFAMVQGVSLPLKHNVVPRNKLLFLAVFVTKWK
jgi:thiol-disulfide isomerase/thioredoxin